MPKSDPRCAPLGEARLCPYCGRPMSRVRGRDRRGWHCEGCQYSQVTIGGGDVGEEDITMAEAMVIVKAVGDSY